MVLCEGRLSVVTGIPNSGKSEFVDALMVNLAMRYGWHFAVCSLENPPGEHISKLAEKYLGLPFWDGPTRRMSESELMRAMDWADDHFHLIRFDEEAPTIEAILDKARAAVMRHGARGLVIDPYNELEHRRPSHMTETEYVSQLLGKVKRFAQNHGVHIWFIAHPAKMQRENGSLPPPTLYDISGSANWANKADIGIVVHRDLPIKVAQVR
jgi:twinkle protein